MWFVPVILISFMIAVSVTSAAISTIRPATDKYTGIWGQTRLKKFSSYEELENFVNAAYYTGNFYSGVRMAGGLISVPLAMSWGANSEYDSDYVKYIINPGSDISIDYSTTNIQVDGVDEADIVKTDGGFIYVVSGTKVFIIAAYPAENARILSRIEENQNPREIFVNGDKLVVLGWNFAKVYDVSNRENPVLKRSVSFDGRYFDSRMIGDFVYLVINAPIYILDNVISLPTICSNGKVMAIQATEIYYFENFRDSWYEFTTIMAINTQNDDQAVTSETFLIGSAQNIFVSSNNIYITYTNGGYMYIEDDSNNEKTVIHKISIADGRIEYKCWGEVSGSVLNQFSMDEYQGYLRIATTTGDVWGDGARNNVYVLDGNLNIAGKLENLSQGKRIYSARFMGNRAYMVTFRRVDPLYVIDLVDPANPRVLGELEIPGYSDYLHPYDETHIIGVGWNNGVKIALFDVSDPENPREISKYETSGYSEVSSDHKAFLFSKSKNLLVVPMGGYWNQDAYVFHISLDNGIMLKGNISHSGDDEYYWNHSVKRSLYIENVLYTISDGMIKMNDLADLHAINSIELPSSFQSWPIGYYSVSV